jgi:hypothetical protein
MPAYGYRARIGYTCPVFLAEIFPFDFYRMAPDGVSLLLATMSVWEGTEEEMKLSAQQSMRAAKEMARAGADIVVFGGVPVNFAAGGNSSVEDVVKGMEDDCGVPVTASLLCQNAALKAIGAKKVVVLRSGAGRNEKHMGGDRAAWLHAARSPGPRPVDARRDLRRGDARRGPRADQAEPRCRYLALPVAPLADGGEHRAARAGVRHQCHDGRPGHHLARAAPRRHRRQG